MVTVLDKLWTRVTHEEDLELKETNLEH